MKPERSACGPLRTMSSASPLGGRMFAAQALAETPGGKRREDHARAILATATMATESALRQLSASGASPPTWT
jgi:hypothetical protein